MPPKKKTYRRRKKFVVWLHNHRDRADDEWTVVWEYTRAKANRTPVDFDEMRFSRGPVYSAMEFYRNNGFAAQ